MVDLSHLAHVHPPAVSPDAYRGVPTVPEPITLAILMGDLDRALAQVTTIRSAVARAGDAYELTEVRLANMAACLTDAIRFGDRGLRAWHRSAP